MYSCFPGCKTGTKQPLELESCGLFREIEDLSLEVNRYSEARGRNGQKTESKILRLKQRCSACVTKAVAAKVAERKAREEKEREAERNGERGEVLRQLRMEEDEEEEEETPRASQHQFTDANFPLHTYTPGKKLVWFLEPVELVADMEDELRDGASFQKIVESMAIKAQLSLQYQDQNPHRFTNPDGSLFPMAAITATIDNHQDKFPSLEDNFTTPLSPMSTLLSDTASGEGSPKLLGDTEGNFGLGIYF
ncbi:uncharacterized protein EAE97_011600 [Botrytis byssoidea]|uniref:Uncharacterized protein n=1 Tax=Botrytis byssoidea TaxID=139641 RepID=A0A9P5LRK9_9HELO|nr:uncharacterized protein EAE97_011600 [Botrytis byssoidea]KAF7919682.1 hypothetical protein EAE97_011600 [Botrytis byssoidea]